MMKQAVKSILPIWMVFFIFIFSIFFIFIPSFKWNLIKQKKEMIQNLTDSAVSLLSEYNKQVHAGRLSLEDAKTRAVNQIRYLRYGPEGKDYFWIIDMHPFMLMHPHRPDLEGADLTPFRDIDGSYPFLAMVEKVLASDAGYVNYYWQYKDTPEKVIPKISYVKRFAPWGWIVGTGMYVEDINRETAAVLTGLKEIAFAVLLFILGLSIFLTWQSMSVRKKKQAAEDALRKETNTLSMILESTPHGIALYDHTGRYSYLNPFFTRITGYTIDDIPTRDKWYEKAYPDEEYRRQVMGAWTSDAEKIGTGMVREYMITCRDGKTRHIEFRTSFSADKIISVLTDVTSRKESEETRREKDRLEAVLELSGAVCHELNQPLMAAFGYLELILMDLADTDPLKPEIDEIMAQLNRMADITSNLMKISSYRTKSYLKGKILDIDAASLHSGSKLTKN